MNSPRFLKYVWPFFNIMKEKVKKLLLNIFRGLIPIRLIVSFCFFSIWVFFHEHSQITELLGGHFIIFHFFLLREELGKARRNERKPKPIAHFDFIYCQLNQSNFLVAPLYVHKLQFISNKLRSSSSSHGQLRKLVCLSSHRGSHF